MLSYSKRIRNIGAYKAPPHESGYIWNRFFFSRNDPLFTSFTWNQWICSLKPNLFETLFFFAANRPSVHMKPMNQLIKTASGFFKTLSRMVQDPINTNPAKKIRGFKNVWIHPSTALRWCYAGRFATTIFSARQHYNIVATLFLTVATLFQHCYAVFSSKFPRVKSPLLAGRELKIDDGMR